MRAVTFEEAPLACAFAGDFRLQMLQIQTEISHEPRDPGVSVQFEGRYRGGGGN